MAETNFHGRKAEQHEVNKLIRLNTITVMEIVETFRVCFEDGLEINSDNALSELGLAYRCLESIYTMADGGQPREEQIEGVFIDDLTQPD